jgi:hypothetical protein
MFLKKFPKISSVIISLHFYTSLYALNSWWHVDKLHKNNNEFIIFQSGLI